MINNVVIPCLNEYFMYKSPELFNCQNNVAKTALDVVLNIKKQEYTYHKAFNGEYEWRVTGRLLDSPSQQVLTTLKVFFKTTVKVELYSKAYRKDMIVNEAANDYNQHCINLSSTRASRSEKSSRFDYNVIVNYQQQLIPAAISSFIVATSNKQTSIFVVVQVFQCTVHEYSTSLVNYASKRFFKTSPTAFGTGVFPLSSVERKCNLYKNGDIWTWFY